MGAHAAGRGALGIHGVLGAPAQFDEADALGALAHDVIDDEGDVGVGAEVAVLR